MTDSDKWPAGGCRDSFKWFPWLWRGICFGRSEQRLRMSHAQRQTMDLWHLHEPTGLPWCFVLLRGQRVGVCDRVASKGVRCTAEAQLEPWKGGILSGIYLR